jgi:hypothetical protein
MVICSLKIDFATGISTEEEDKDLVAEFLDVQSKPTLIISAVYIHLASEHV